MAQQKQDVQINPARYSKKLEDQLSTKTYELMKYEVLHEDQQTVIAQQRQKIQDLETELEELKKKQAYNAGPPKRKPKKKQEDNVVEADFEDEEDLEEEE